MALKLESLETSREIRSRWDSPHHPLTHLLPGVRGHGGAAAPAAHSSHRWRRSWRRREKLPPPRVSAQPGFLRLETGAVPQTGVLKRQVVDATGKREAPNPPSCCSSGPRNNSANCLPRSRFNFAGIPALKEPFCVPGRKRKAVADLSATPEG